ncbi:MAG TPA: hypothetical protein DCK93_14015 [Blastocatellia bacterium]|jgi:hypothetical protein|nr:hypothetical protein [Blastocatellia bacterium]HAF23999.1 hypothetical protein [Blastocatellia bacterium]
MKKILALLSLLIIAAACAAPPTNREAASSANTNLAETASTATITEANAIANEKAVWATLEKKDYAAFGNMLTSDYIEVGDDNAYDKPGIINYLKDLDISGTTFSDWKLMPIDKDAVILMYNVNVKGTFKGQEVPPGPYRASSAWVNRGGKWQAIYYQETLASSSPPPPPASSPAAKNAASPAKKTAVVPGDDPVVNEKLAWEAIKRKDYDTFASFLDSNQVEVEADGVYDKAGTLKGVTMVDASKSEQSDFKTVKVDSVARLVTYLVTIPGAKPDKERHSTIWVNRGGKWLALFHQGTPVMPPATTTAPKGAASPSPKAAVSPAVKAPAKKM